MTILQRYFGLPIAQETGKVRETERKRERGGEERCVMCGVLSPRLTSRVVYVGVVVVHIDMI